MKTRTMSRVFSICIVVALVLGTLPFGAPVFSQSPVETPPPPQTPPPLKEGAVPVAPPIVPPANPPIYPASMLPGNEIGPAPSSESASQPLQPTAVCSTTLKKIPFGQDLELMMGPAGTYSSTSRVDLPPGWTNQTANWWQTEILTGTQADGSCAPTVDQVAVYRDTDYGGPCSILTVGNYPKPKNLNMPVNNTISSMKIGGNVHVTFYQYDDYGGKLYYTATAQIPRLSDITVGSFNFNDKISSMKVGWYPQAYGSVSVAANGTDLKQVLYKTDSASGELAGLGWLPDLGWSGPSRTGKRSASNPVVVSKNGLDLMYFIRVGTQIYARQQYAQIWEADWQKVLPESPNGTPDAASDPVPVVLSPEHIVLFYKTSANVVKFTEWVDGGWRTTPVALTVGSDPKITSGLSAISRDESHVVVFGITANNALLAKEWSYNTNRSDWGDTTWVTLMSPTLTGANKITVTATITPAAASRYMGQVGVMAFGPSNQVYYREWTSEQYESYPNGAPRGWTNTISAGTKALSSLGLVGTSAEEMFAYGLDSSGNFYAQQWKLSGGWQGWSSADAGWAADQTIGAAVGRPHDIMFIGRDTANRVKARRYTDVGMMPVVARVTNPGLGVLRGQTIATVQGRTIWASVYRSNTGAWMIEARDTFTWQGVSKDTGAASADTAANNVSVAAGDLNGDGDDEIVLATLNTGGSTTTFRVFTLTLTGSSVTSINTVLTEAYPNTVAVKDINVAVGDMDGDGQADDVAVATLSPNYNTVALKMYEFFSTTGYTAFYEYGSTSASFSGLYSADDLEMTVGRVDDDNRDQFVLGLTAPNQPTQIATYRYNDGDWSISQVHAMTVTAGVLPGPYSTAIGTGDVDSDGYDEVVYTAGGTINVLSVDHDVDTNVPGSVSAVDTSRSLAVGDVDGDGRDEIVYTNLSPGSATVLKQMSAFNTTLGTVSTAAVSGVPLLADVDGDSGVATYRSCNEYKDIRVVAVVNSYPMYYMNGLPVQKTTSGMANGNNTEDGSVDGWSTTFGASIAFGFQYSWQVPILAIKLGELRFKVSQQFLGSIGRATERASSVTEISGFAVSEPSKGGVCYTNNTYRCYQFDIGRNNSTYTTTARSCLVVMPPPHTNPQTCVTLEDWYATGAGKIRDTAGTSWVPVGHHTTASGPNVVSINVTEYPTRTTAPVDPYSIWWEKKTAIPVIGSVVGSAGGVPWSIEKANGTRVVSTTTFNENTEISDGFTAFNITYDAALTAGYGKNWGRSISWKDSLQFSGSVFNYPASSDTVTPTVPCPATVCTGPYSVVPFIYIAKATTQAGIVYSYLEQDYYRTDYSGMLAAEAEPQAITGVTPQAPIITSTTHPDPATWYSRDTITFNWSQPGGDPATVVGYRWNLDQTPVITPTSVNTLSTTQTYLGVPDGIYYLHVQALGDDGNYGPVTHRAVKVDRDAPQVQIIPNPIAPDGLNGWYNSPLTVTVSATDTVGSGVMSVETSADGTNWQPYSTPIPFTANTAGVTLWARATDNLGQTSTPVSLTIKLDKTKPSTINSDKLGLSYANVITDEVGNAQLVLGGALNDALSGGMQVEMRSDAGPWNVVNQVGTFPMPPDNEISTTITTLNWIYTPTFEVRGVYYLWGRGVDVAGNFEAAWAHGIFWWEPDDVPVLDESRVSVSPHQAKPGDVVDFTVAARNSGYQESQYLITDTVPAGLTVLPDSISDNGQYVTGTHVITWTLHALWPGQTRYLFFSATADNTTTPVTLTNQVDLMGYWLWLDYPGIPAEPARHYYSTNTALTVLPSTSAPINAANSVAQTAPQIVNASVSDGEIVNHQEVTLAFNTTPGARSLYVKEWTWNNDLNKWNLARESGWVPFEDAADFEVSEDNIGKYGRYQWSLSEGDGVKYLGLWVADANGQVSNLNEGNLIYTNLMSESGQQLLPGQTIQYRLNMRASQLAVLTLVSLSGDADLYVWKPRAGFMPNYYSNAAPPDQTLSLSLDTVGFLAPEEGMYIVEVQAATDAYYRLVTAGDLSSSGLLAETKVNPARVSLSAGDLAVLKAQDEAVSTARETMPQSTHLPLVDKARPAHPTTLTTPFTLGNEDTLPPLVVGPHVFMLYFPVVMK